MKRRRSRKKRNIHPKHIYIILAVLCLFFTFFSFKYYDKVAGLKTALGDVVSPMQKGINVVGEFISDQFDMFKNKKDLLAENEELKKKVDSLNYDNKILAGENVELETYRKAFKLDKKYPNYPKVAARVISRDGNNWYNVFTIDKGKSDGIDVDMNVIAGNGLVGIVSEVGEHYAKVRSIIDDKSNVSAMFMSTSETCIVKGNLQSISKGYIDVELISSMAKIKDGAEVVTSHISEKYLQGLLVGYVSEIKEDKTKLTKTAKLTPVVSFDNLDLVLVITKKKNPSDIGDVLKK